MSKNFKLYLTGWLVSLGLFNAIVFVTPNEIGGISKFDTLFWIAYATITLIFIGQLACAYYVFASESLQHVFYSLPLLGGSLSAIRLNVLTLALLLIFGTVCLTVIPIPEWVGIILCCVALASNILSVIKTSAGVNAIEQTDKRIKQSTLFIKMLTSDAESLKARAKGGEYAARVEKIYDAIRYSDPMSNEALAYIEGKISESFAALSDSVASCDSEGVERAAKSLLDDLAERNAKCKALK